MERRVVSRNERYALSLAEITAAAESVEWELREATKLPTRPTRQHDGWREVHSASNHK